MKQNEQDQIRRELAGLWRKIRLTERGQLSGEYRAFLAHPDETKKDALLEKLSAAAKRSLAYHAKKLTCDFPPDLPITEKIPQIRTALKENQVVIVCGSTGSGKTTQLPKAALAEGFGRSGRIGCTQPRRLAATALAARFAAETGVNAGYEVGYKVRFDDKTTDCTVVKFMTDGILLAETKSDPMLLQYDCIILDEVHERSLNIDFLLGYLKLLLAKRRDLRIIISSATLESGRIAEFFNGAPVIEVEGKLFPIEDIYQEMEEEEELPEAIARAAETLAEIDRSGDVLVFLPGEREIRDAADMLEGRNYAHTEILPLFGRLSAAEQNRIFKKSSSGRRIILATNVAETSLTIPGIRFVIDSGLVRISRYNPRSGIQELRVEFISKASARQRRGRCGRLRSGVCIHLYPEQRLEETDDYTAPEIQRSSLAGVILQMAALKLPEIESFPFVDPPGFALIKEGRLTLEDLGATDERSRLTKTGWALAELPVGPRLGKMLLEAKLHNVLPEMLVIAAYLSLPDPKERPFDHAKEADAAQRQFDADGSDFLSALILWRAMGKQPSQSALRKFAQKNYLNFRRLREWRNLVDDLAEIIAPTLTSADLFEERSFDPDTVHKVLMSALPRQLGLFDPEKKCYIDRNGKKYQVFPGSALAKAKSAAKWILSFTIVETTRPYARCNAVVEGMWLEKAAPHLCTKTYDAIRWDETTGFVSAREKVMAGQLLIHPGRRCHYGKIDPAKAREVFIREALAQGRLHLPDVAWVARFERDYHALRRLEIKLRRPESLLDTGAVFHHFERVLPRRICSADDVRKSYFASKKKDDFAPDRENMVYDPADLKYEEDYPDFIIQSGQKFHLSYAFAPGERKDGLIVTVPETKLTLLEPHLTEWMVPGALRWKVEPMLRSLPKNIRKEIMPIGDLAEDFYTRLKNGELFTDQRFIDALADHIAETRGVVLDKADFDVFEAQEFQKMKIAVVDEDGKFMHFLYEVPDAARTGSRLKPNKKLHAEGCTDWPEGITLPPDLAISPDGKKRAYPALCDEGQNSVGVTMFLNAHEAKTAHTAGLRRLVKLKYPQMIRHLGSMPKFPHDMQLSLFLHDPKWKDSLVDHAIDNAWQTDVMEIRSGQTFEAELEKLRDEAALSLAGTIRMLEDIYQEYIRAARSLKQIREDSETFEDAQSQLDFLFRKGFLQTPDAVAQYKRYLKSLAIRLDRARSDLNKDAEKGSPISEYIYKFQLAAVNSEKPLEELPYLYDFFLLLEEARIAAFTPEIRTTRKATAAILQDAWKKLRL